MDPGLNALLDELEASTGVSFDPTTFAGRVRIQKAVYLLQVLGHEPLSVYAFSMYHHGPYSPALARAYYGKDGSPGLRVADAIPPRDVLEIAVHAIRRGTPFLESVATLHRVAHQNPSASRDAVIAHTRELKPKRAEHMEEAWAFLEDHGLLPRGQ